LVGFLLFWLLLWKLPQRQVAAVPEVKDRIDLESKSRQTLVQIVGGAAALGALYFTAQTLQVSQETLRTTRDGQITDRFTKAIDQLGKETLDVRLGGIYALGRIANDSPKDHWQIMEVLTAYVREHASWPPKYTQPLENKQGLKEKQQGEKREDLATPTTDVQAGLTVIGRRNGETQRLDLRNTNLQGVNLAGAQLQGADLDQARLQRADLAGADLAGADLARADLARADLARANLQKARLQRANLQ